MNIRYKNSFLLLIAMFVSVFAGETYSRAPTRHFHHENDLKENHDRYTDVDHDVEELISIDDQMEYIISRLDEMDQLMGEKILALNINLEDIEYSFDNFQDAWYTYKHHFTECKSFVKEIDQFVIDSKNLIDQMKTADISRVDDLKNEINDLLHRLNMVFENHSSEFELVDLTMDIDDCIFGSLEDFVIRFGWYSSALETFSNEYDSFMNEYEALCDKLESISSSLGLSKEDDDIVSTFDNDARIIRRFS